MENTDNNKDQNIITGDATPEAIQIWKGKHRKLIEISVVDGDEKHFGYFHRPSMEAMSMMNKLSTSDEVRGANALFDSCWVGGSAEMKEDAVIKMAAIKALSSIFTAAVGELKNL